VDLHVRKELAARLREVLPDAADRIDRCLVEYETFRDICENYEECALGLQRWYAAPERFEQRIEEYSRLLLDLEDEILQFLKERE